MAGELPGNRLLIVDDDSDFAQSLCELAETAGYDTETIASARLFTDTIETFAPHVVMLDVRLAEADGVDLLKSLNAGHPEILAIMMSAYAGTDSTVQALRHHAYDFLRKPVSVDEFFGALKRAFEHTRLVTEMRQAEHAMRLSEEKFSKAFLCNPDPISITALDDGVVLDINDAYEAVTGYSRADIVGRVSEEFGLWIDPQARRAMLARLEAGNSVDRLDSVFRRKTGELIFAQVSAEVVEISGRRCAIVHARDTTAEKQATMALAESEERFRSLYHATPSIFFTLTEDCVIKSVNSFGANHLGYEIDDLAGNSILGLMVPESRVAIRQSISQCFSQPGAVREWEIQFLHRDGNVRWLRQTANAVRDTNGVHELLLASEDITNAKHLSEQLSYQASHDSLTGLVNRREFERRLERVLLTVARDNTESVLCYLDLDQFKVINDTCGHIAGDDLLRQVTAVLQSVVRKRDTLARLGGDEFAILLEDCDIQKGMRVAESILSQVNNFRFAWSDKYFSVGVSVGMVSLDASCNGIIDALGAADSACYTAKESGRNRVHIYHAEDLTIARRHGEMQWVARLRAALDEDRLTLYRQRILPLSDAAGEPHYEYLVRLLDEQGNVVLPGAFLPAAERYNLISQVDRWVIRKVFEIMASTSDAMDANAIANINISGQSIGEKDFLDFVEASMLEFDVYPDKICFEITETVAIANIASANRIIASLRERGCRFALDDFGSGFASFAYLSTLSVDFLKIDGQFILGIDSDPIKRAMARSINEIAHVMGKRTIAEVVENDAALEEIRKLGIDYAQGFGIALPEPVPQGKLIREASRS